MKYFLGERELQKFRESNVFTKEITKELISRKKNFSEREFLVFPHCGFVHLLYLDNGTFPKLEVST